MKAIRYFVAPDYDEWFAGQEDRYDGPEDEQPVWDGNEKDSHEWLAEYPSFASYREALAYIGDHGDLDSDHIYRVVYEHVAVADMRRRQFDNVSARFGAPLGRDEVVCSAEQQRVADLRYCLFRVEFMDGDYDDGGAYWGSGGGALYCLRVWGPANGELVLEAFERAKTSVAAHRQLRKRLPHLAVLQPGEIMHWEHGFEGVSPWNDADRSLAAKETVAAATVVQGEPRLALFGMEGYED